MTAFKFGNTLRSQLSKVKDRIPTNMSSLVVYRIPCCCGMIYIGETSRKLEQKVKEHQDTYRNGDEKSSAIAEHA